MAENLTPSEIARALAKLPRKPRKETEKTCLCGCEKTFTTRSNNRRYFSRACQVRVYRRNKKEQQSSHAPAANALGGRVSGE